MQDIKIISPRPDRIPALSRVLAASWKWAYRGIVPDPFLDELPEDRWVPYLETGLTRPGTHCLAAECGEDIVGVAVCQGSRSTQYPGDGELASLYLLSQYAGQGLGARLLGAAEDSLRGDGHTHCTLAVLEHNRRAIDFYVNHSYVDTGHREPVTLDGTRLSCLVLRKAL